jgi:hypothetical protein
MKEFFADHYFQIGGIHLAQGKPCQDYALSGFNGKAACAIVSDGCSTGRHTDVGSRIEVMTTLEAIKSATLGELTAEEGVRVVARKQRELVSAAKLALGLTQSDLLATRLYVYLGNKGGYIHVAGDGVIAMKYKSGEIGTSKFEWANNMPYYPAYTDIDLVEFVLAQGGEMESPRLKETLTTILSDGSFGPEIVQEYSLRQGVEGILIQIEEDKLQELEFVAIFTDGITQIENIHWVVAVQNLLSFKSTEGDFAKRRMIRGIKQLSKSGNNPLDDIAYGVIRIKNSSALTEVNSDDSPKGEPESIT